MRNPFHEDDEGDWQKREERLVLEEAFEEGPLTVRLIEVGVYDRSDMPRGWASLLPETHRLLASKGGKEGQRQPGARRWTSSQAKEAGQKGGQSTQARRRQRAGLV